MNQDDYLRAIEEQQRAEELKNAALFRFFTKEARERFRRVELVHKELANNALMIILQAVQTGRLSIVDDKTLKAILSSVNNKPNYRVRL